MQRSRSVRSSRATRRRGAAIKRPHSLIPAELRTVALAVLVLGSYGSGTSALAGVIRLLGADSPPNCDGSAALMKINNELASTAGSEWDDWRALDRSLRSAPGAQLLKERALDALRMNFMSSRLFVVHDPVICRFLPFWRAIVDEFKARPVVVLLVRNPFEVIDSLRRHDGCGSSTSCLLWLRHTLDAERASRDLPRAVVTYDALLSDWTSVISRLQIELGLRWPRRSDLVELEIEQFLRDPVPSPNADPPELPREVKEWLMDAYDAVVQLSAGRHRKKSWARLDKIRSEFDRACAIFGPLLSGHESGPAKSRSARAGGDARTDAELKNADEGTRQLCDELKDSGLFDRRWYLQSYPDVRGMKSDPLVHYLHCGAAEGRDPNPFFDTGWYLEQNPDVKSAGINPLAHYLHHGAAEGRDPSPLFDTDWYRHEHPDVAASGLNPLAHYLKIGGTRGHRPKPAR